MRQIPSKTEDFVIHSSPPPASTPTLVAPQPSDVSCDAHKCPWWPYSSSRDFKINTTLVLVFLVCTVIFALAFNIAIRYIITQHCMRRRQEHRIPTEVNRSVEIPSVIYSEGMKLAGTEDVCAICLSELLIGERISVGEKCGHGFHVQCIQRWLASHPSCPTCRANC